MTSSIETRAVHAGEHALPPEFTPVTTPVYNSVAYEYGSMDTLDAIFEGDQAGFVYGRYGNPTVSALEQACASLEGSEDGVAFSTGMGAVHGGAVGCGRT